MTDTPIPSRVGNWYVLDNLGAGFSGSIWRAHNPYTNQVAAIKMQDIDNSCPTNQYEKYIYPLLQGGEGMPTLWAHGEQGGIDYLVIDLLGPSLDSLYKSLEPRIMDIETVLQIALQVLSRLELMHSRGVLHRDIQLGNCVVGLGEKASTIYMIDFGFSKVYIDRQTRRHMPDSNKKRCFIGNYWFSSVNVHCRGRVPSRRDDLEALALMLIHVLTPDGLPWTRKGVPKDDANERRVEQEKLAARPEDLCFGLPDVFENFLRYCRRLKFAEMPDYDYWRSQFRDLARNTSMKNKLGDVDESFKWPPRRSVQKADERESRLPLANKVHKKKDDVEVDRILKDLAGMTIQNHNQSSKSSSTETKVDQQQKHISFPPIATIEDKVSPAKEFVQKGRFVQPNSEQSNDSKDVLIQQQQRRQSNETSTIVISSDSESDQSDYIRTPIQKAQLLRRLNTSISQTPAFSSIELSTALKSFISIMQKSKSKVVTKEALFFLELFYQKLSGSPIYKKSKVEDLDIKEYGSDRKEAICRLRRELILAGQESKLDWSMIAEIVSDFSAAIQLNKNRTLTKDGFRFLDTVEYFLRSAVIVQR